MGVVDVVVCGSATVASPCSVAPVFTEVTPPPDLEDVSKPLLASPPTTDKAFINTIINTEYAYNESPFGKTKIVFTNKS